MEAQSIMGIQEGEDLVIHFSKDNEKASRLDET